MASYMCETWVMSAGISTCISTKKVDSTLHNSESIPNGLAGNFPKTEWKECTQTLSIVM